MLPGYAAVHRPIAYPSMLQVHTEACIVEHMDRCAQTSVKAGGTVEATFSERGDTDWYAITLDAPGGLTLSVEAGKDFVSSLRDILARRRLDPLGEEFMRTFQEIQLGKKRTEALREMAQRVRQPELTSTLNAVIQAEEMGVSIANLLRIQGDALRNKRFTRAEKLANEAPVKIILPIILFIFPSVLIILGLPMFMQIARFF